MSSRNKWAHEVDRGERFRFGSNWQRYLRDIDKHRIAAAEDGLRAILGTDHLGGKSFLDVGCGSGLSSLAARNLGAIVTAFDFDPDSVAASELLKARMRPGDDEWRIEQGSVLNAEFLSSLGTFDFVYSWGVLHHTGALWEALENVLPLVRLHGTLALALYNDQGRLSRRALVMKRTYVTSGPARRKLMVWWYTARTVLRGLLADLRDHRNPLRRLGSQPRGMSTFTDIVDWVGGYPFEVAKPEQVLAAVRADGFELAWLRTIGGGSGNNEYRFERVGGIESARDAQDPT